MENFICFFSWNYTPYLVIACFDQNSNWEATTRGSDAIGELARWIARSARSLHRPHSLARRRGERLAKIPVTYNWLIWVLETSFIRLFIDRLTEPLHDFACETALTTEEWMTALHFLTAIGQICCSIRQEFVLFSDVLGLSVLVDAP